MSQPISQCVMCVLTVVDMNVSLSIEPVFFNKLDYVYAIRRTMEQVKEKI